MPTIRAFGALPCLVTLATGCVAMPVVSPPLQIAVGSGARSLSSDTLDGALDAPAQVRVALHPLSLFKEQENRRLDVGAGYLLDYGASGQIQGGYLEASVALLQRPLGGGIGRLSLRVQARLIHAAQEGALGQGGALQLTADLAGHTDRGFESVSETGGAFGHAYGEGGIGLFLEGSYQHAGSLNGWAATGGLLLRVPASVGIAYAWIWTLL